MLCIFSATAFAAETVKPAEEKEETVQISAKLTGDDALAAALKDAGKSEADVMVKKNSLSEKETETGEKVAVYTVRFNDETTNYKYFVEANTGEILYKNIEYQKADMVFKGRDRGEKDASEKESRGTRNTNGKDSNPTELDNIDASADTAA